MVPCIVSSFPKSVSQETVQRTNRAIHHGTDDQVVELLQRLLQKRPALKERFEISEDILFRMYGVE